jgi:hypothetical protein
MNIDERLDKLTERHEASAQSMELVHHDIRDLLRTTEALERTTNSLVRTAEIDAENIRALARIAEIHDRRLTDLEGQ